MQNAELELISICSEIGSISERNNLYTFQLSQQIKQPIEEMTVGELLAIHKQTLESFNGVVK